jgi:hypothetical protein
MTAKLSQKLNAPTPVLRQRGDHIAGHRFPLGSTNALQFRRPLACARGAGIPHRIDACDRVVAIDKRALRRRGAGSEDNR